MTRAGSATARALIVDDERPARERLRKLLTRDSRWRSPAVVPAGTKRSMSCARRRGLARRCS